MTGMSIKRTCVTVVLRSSFDGICAWASLAVESKPIDGDGNEKRLEGTMINERYPERGEVKWCRTAVSIVGQSRSP